MERDVEVTDDLLIGAALLMPGYCRDLSTWRTMVSVDGTVTQELRIVDRSETLDDHCIRLRTVVARETIANIESITRSIGFLEFKEKYSVAATDQATTSITVKLDGVAKRVTAYGAGLLAHSDPDMAGYRKLWEIMWEISPYRGIDKKVAPLKTIRRRLSEQLEFWNRDWKIREE